MATPEQAFQLKLAATDLAIRAGATLDTVVDSASRIYDFISGKDEQAAKEAALEAKVMQLRKPTITEIGVALNRE